MRERVSEDLQALNSQSVMSISSDTPGRMFGEFGMTSTEKVYVCPLVRPEISVVVRPLSTSILPSPPPPARP